MSHAITDDRDVIRERARSSAKNRARAARSRRQSRSAWAVTAVAAAVAAAVSTAQPTGESIVIDRVWAAVFVGGLAIVASRATRLSWIWMAGVAGFASVGSWSMVLAVVALGLAVSGALQDHRSRMLGAGVGAFGGLALIVLPDIGFHGLGTIVAVVAVAPVLVASYRRSPRRVRRTMTRVATWGTVGIVLAGGIAAGSAALAVPELMNGLESAQIGLDAAREGDQDTSRQQFTASQAAFDHAGSLTGGVWTWPARAIPVVSQHVRAADIAASSGADLANSALVAVSTAPYRDLKAANGQVDVEQVRAMQQPIAEAAASLGAAEADLEDLDSEWLIGPVRDEMAVVGEEVRSARDETDLAEVALDAAPTLLGADVDRRYLVVFTNPAEARNLGGFAGAYAVLEASGGSVDLTDSGEIADLADTPPPGGFVLDAPEDFLLRYRSNRVEEFFQNVTVSPDMPTTTRVAASLFEQSTGLPVDGAIVADPSALAGFLDLSGPVTVPGLDLSITADNVVDFLQRDQYIAFGDSGDRRQDRLDEVGRATFDALTERELPGPAVVGRTLGPLVASKHLMFDTFIDDAGPLLDRLGIRGELEVPEQADFLSVRYANTLPNKIDTFVSREIDYDVAYDPSTERVESTVTIRISNAAPDRGYVPYVIGPEHPTRPLGTARMVIAVYTPLSATGATLDGEPTGIEPQRELGARVYSVPITIGPRSEATVVLTLDGTIEGMGDTYTLDTSSQPMANPDELGIRVRSFDGGGARGEDNLDTADGVATTRREWDSDLRFSAYVDG